MTENQKRFEDLADRSLSRGYNVFTDFLGIAEISELYGAEYSVPVTLWGGFEGAERAIACFGDREFLTDNADYPINCILIEPVNQKFADDLIHRDFLGSLMGLGIRRQVLGDIIICENCGYLFCLDTISQYIVENLTQVKHTTVKCSLTDEIPQNALPQPEKIELIVASTRLDVVVSAIYNLSRSKASLLFTQGKVFVNGKEEQRTSINLKENDRITVRGFGRFVFCGVLRKTKKERSVIGLDKF